MDESRRSFLKRIGYVAMGAGCAAPLLGAAGRVLHEGLESATPPAKQWGLVIDIKKCLSEDVRRACTEACHREHNVPQMPDPKDEVKWIWSESYENAFPDEAHPYTADSLKNKPVLILCNHCTHPPCVKVCPTRATWKREQDGIVMMDMHRCIGCRFCMAACPYGARSFNYRDPRPFIKNENKEYPTRTKGVVEKCTFCTERLAVGKLPACVEAAPKGGLLFGDLADKNSEVRKIVETRYTIRRKPELGTGPSVYYLIGGTEHA
jgi:Fe-S-cluster-containing dehydrogenase component